MTSPGLKRPLDLELATSQTNNKGTESIDAGIKSDEVRTGAGSQGHSPNDDHEPNAIGTKRRCTDTNYHAEAIETRVKDEYPRSSPPEATMRSDQQQHQHYIAPSPTPRDPSLSSLEEDINNLIRNELFLGSQHKRDLSNLQPVRDEQIVLTARQIHSICEKLIANRERKLRDEYDRRLASKLAEQYDLFAKANYLNTFAEPSRSQTPASTAMALESKTAVAIANQPVSTSAIAGAYMHRSAPISMVSPASSPNPVPSATASMPNLNTIAANYSANGHHSTIQSPHHHLAPYNVQQHHAAAVAAMRLAQQQQQQQQQQRISMPIVNANSLIPSGPVLLTSNLDEQLATPEALFTLFGVFGDVIRVKILFNKKDNALIQMADASRAQVAQSYLDKQRIFGKVIRVNRSKHQIVQMPRDGGQSDAGLTKDFTNSPLHRFKIPGSRNYLNIYPPSNTLHVSNIPATIDESDLHKAFRSQCGFEFTSFKFFPKDRKMALMRFDSVEFATIALIKMHNYQISDENNLRVSFSKSAL